MNTGFPSPAQHYHEKNMNLQDYLVPHPETTFFMRARTSYQEHDLQKGDMLVIDRGCQPSSRDLVVAVVDGQRCLVQFEELARHSAQKEDTAEIWGTVTYVVRSMRAP